MSHRMSFSRLIRVLGNHDLWVGMDGITSEEPAAGFAVAHDPIATAIENAIALDSGIDVRLDDATLSPTIATYVLSGSSPPCCTAPLERHAVLIPRDFDGRDLRTAKVEISAGARLEAFSHLDDAVDHRSRRLSARLSCADSTVAGPGSSSKSITESPGTGTVIGRPETSFHGICSTKG